MILHYQGYALYRQASVSSQQTQDATPIFERARDILPKSLNSRILPETHSAPLGDRRAADRRETPRGRWSSGCVAGVDERGDPKRPDEPARLADPWPGRDLHSLGVRRRPRTSPRSYLKRAIELFAKDAPKPGEPTWGKAEASAWLGQVYEKNGDKTKAAETYKTALDMSPNYRFAQALAAALK